MDFAAGVYLSEVQTLYPPPPRPTLQIVYVYWEMEPERRLEEHNSQSSVENTNMTDCISSL
jgi:hypothetical protein